MDVIGFGDIDVDIYLEVDRIPSRDEKVMANSVNFYPGGMVANFLVALRRLGTTCGFHGPVGADEYGEIAVKDLKDNQVDTSYMVVKKGKKTYFCVVMLDDSGEKALIVAPTECLAPEEEDIISDAIKSAKHMHTIFHGPAQAKAIQMARENGLTISVDFEPASVKGASNLDDLLSKIDIAFINRNALRLMSPHEDLERAARDVVSRGPKIVCVTSGKEGVLIVMDSKPEAIKVNSFDVPVVDTTGAGDCFAAGFVHGYLAGWPIDFVGRFASATAALKIMSKGGHAGAPKFGQVLSFLKENNITIPENVRENIREVSND
jgi:sugar/nucleoside kinase (ribokinase family)